MVERTYVPILRCGDGPRVVLVLPEDKSFKTEAEVLIYASKQVDTFGFKLDTEEAFKAWYIQQLQAGILGPLTVERFKRLWELWCKHKYPSLGPIAAIEAVTKDIVKQTNKDRAVRRTRRR